MTMMRIHKYIPQKMYGFAIDDAGEQVFFHLGRFHPGEFETTPPPILGEPVDVELDLATASGERNKAPRADRVRRVSNPTQVEGIIETFDAERGYGFIVGEDNVTYHLHQSEVLNNRVPLPQQRARFYPGLRQNRPRACHVQVLRDGET